MPPAIYIDVPGGGGQRLDSPTGGNQLIIQQLFARYTDLLTPIFTMAHTPRYADLDLRLDAYAQSGYKLYALNLSTNIETYLGFAPAGGTLQLSGVSLADGSYMIRVTLAGYYWQDERVLQRFPVQIAGGVFVQPLPAISNLAYTFQLAGTLVTWNWLAQPGTVQPTDFALWTGATLPVDQSGAPAYTTAASSPGAYSILIAQAGPINVAVCARNGSTQGPSQTISIPTPPVTLASPPNQFALFP